MLGNLLKKMEPENIVKENTKSALDSDIISDKKRKIDPTGISEAYQTDKSNKRKFNKRKENPKSNEQESNQMNYKEQFEEEYTDLCEKTGLKLKRNPVSKEWDDIQETIFEQLPNELTDEDGLKNSYERTVEKSRATNQSILNVLFQEKKVETRRFEDQLKKVITMILKKGNLSLFFVQDIEDLKNRKIKEMEDLINIKAKKEQTLSDLEKLKTEIVKHQTILESLKKIKLGGEMNVTPPSLARVDEVKQVETKIPKNQVVACQVIGTEKHNPLNRESQLQSSSEKQLPDLVPQNMNIFNDENGQTNLYSEGIHYLNIYDDYMKHLRMNERNEKTLEQSATPVRISAPHLYNQHIPVNKKQATNILHQYLCSARTGSCTSPTQNIL